MKNQKSRHTGKELINEALQLISDLAAEGSSGHVESADMETFEFNINLPHRKINWIFIQLNQVISYVYLQICI